MVSATDLIERRQRLKEFGKDPLEDILDDMLALDADIHAKMEIVRLFGIPDDEERVGVEKEVDKARQDRLEKLHEEAVFVFRTCFLSPCCSQ